MTNTTGTPLAADVTALVAREVGAAELETLSLRPLGPSDVRVRIEASGLCHSDVSLVDGTLPGKFPVVLGHEGAGVIDAVGTDVTQLAAGQRVALSAMPPCGTCWHCARAETYLCERSAEIRRPPFQGTGGQVRGASGLGTFADAVVVDERAVIPVDTELPADQLAIIGCAVATGAGSVLNVARVEVGESVLVVGAGGVGLAALQAARLSGAAPIIAVDPSPEARGAAARCGATHVAAPDEADNLVRELLDGRGVDVVIECVAHAETFRAAWSMTRRGGRVVLVGVPPRDQRADLALADAVLSGRRVIGSVHGQTVPRRDVQRYIGLAESGRLDLDALIGSRIGFDEVTASIDAHEGTPGRIVAVTSAPVTARGSDSVPTIRTQE